MLDGTNSTKFLTCWLSLQSSHANFQNIFVSPNIVDILNTMLDRADCADFGCHNSTGLETKHFLNTLALTFISFSGRFVFTMQKHYLFFLCERSSSFVCCFEKCVCRCFYCFISKHGEIQTQHNFYLLPGFSPGGRL